MFQRKPLVLVILDGWGYREETIHNAIAAAKTPQWDTWWKNYPHTLLNAYGLHVGLPETQMGNSEVGHMHMGAGRIIHQDFTRINQAITSGEFATNPILLNTLEELKQSGKALHVMGLLSPGGVHSHENHLFAFLALCAELDFKHVYLHLFLDGRDTPPQSALKSIKALNAYLEKYPVAILASLTGRYFAMDRDKRWERLEPVYQLLTEAKATAHYKDALTAINSFYKEQKYDEFIPPTVIGQGRPIEDGDAIFSFNFRADRIRQLTQALIEPDFNSFKRQVRPHLSHFISMTSYAKTLQTEVVFPPITLNNTFGEIIAAHGLSQLRLAETEKYAHVTFFFNGGREQVFKNEDRILIPSPKVATYDLLPEMSAPELTNALIDSIHSDAYDVIICNYANADMVGHTGDFSATVRAIECLDRCLQKLGQAVLSKQGALFITADHGNAEMMFNPTNKQAHTAHTCHPVPFLFVGEGWHFNETNGSLIDIAPSLLTWLGIDKPTEMTGQSLLISHN